MFLADALKGFGVSMASLGPAACVYVSRSLNSPTASWDLPSAPELRCCKGDTSAQAEVHRKCRTADNFCDVFLQAWLTSHANAASAACVLSVGTKRAQALRNHRATEIEQAAT